MIHMPFVAEIMGSDNKMHPRTAIKIFTATVLFFPNFIFFQLLPVRISYKDGNFLSGILTSGNDPE